MLLVTKPRARKKEESNFNCKTIFVFLLGSRFFHFILFNKYKYDFYIYKKNISKFFIFFK